MNRTLSSPSVLSWKYKHFGELCALVYLSPQGKDGALSQCISSHYKGALNSRRGVALCNTPSILILKIDFISIIDTTK